MTRSEMRYGSRLSLGLVALLMLSACNQPFDYDLRGTGGGFSTTPAATDVATEARPAPDARGVISYPSYQVAVAEQGETIAAMSSRLGLNAGEVARFNGIDQNTPLRRGEVVALPSRVAEPTGGTISGPVQPGSVDIASLAGGAIDRASGSGNRVETVALPPADGATAAPLMTGREPIRHKVERGETAYTIARLYKVPVRSLGEWNGLDSDFTVREGQFLLIPVTQAPPAPAPTVQTAAVTTPGTGSPTPTPPSASAPLPEPVEPVVLATPEPVDVGTPAATASQAAMSFPVQGSIIRPYAKGRNEGIDIKASPGTPVKAADTGTVAAITKSAEGIPIIVIRHDPELLTVYANVTDVTVKKGDQIARGAPIAKLREGDDAYVHFEVRQGFDSVDPQQYLQ